MPRIGEPAERHPEQGIEDREGGAIEKADIGVVQAQVALQVGREDGDDLPVDELEDIDEVQYAERIPLIGRLLYRRPYLYCTRLTSIHYFSSLFPSSSFIFFFFFFLLFFFLF